MGRTGGSGEQGQLVHTADTASKSNASGSSHRGPSYGSSNCDGTVCGCDAAPRSNALLLPTKPDILSGDKGCCHDLPPDRTENPCAVSGSENDGNVKASDGRITIRAGDADGTKHQAGV